jgi:hypothetical protein
MYPEPSIGASLCSHHASARIVSISEVVQRIEQSILDDYPGGGA